VPIGRWLRGPLREWAINKLENKLFEQISVRPKAAMELFSEHCNKKADHARTLWTLIVLSEWLDWAVTETAGSGISADKTDAQLIAK
jgi:asparagine synthase (glutamine-hydrolysing)